jgi:copper(I)-binding protein
MKRLTIALAVITLAAVAARCGSNSTPTQPTNLVVFTVQLSPANEVPAITNAENVARGTAVITVHKDTNAIDFAVSVNSFPAGSSLILAHIHGPNAPAGVAANVFVNTLLTAGTAPALSNGAATFNLTNTATADQVSQILANPSQFYFNVHTVQNGGGVMRGQLQ